MRVKLFLKLQPTTEEPENDALVQSSAGILYQWSKKEDIAAYTLFEHTVVKPYGLSDTKPKEGDWVYNLFNDTIRYIITSEDSRVMLLLPESITIEDVEASPEQYKKIELHPDVISYTDIIELGLKDLSPFVALYDDIVNIYPKGFYGKVNLWPIDEPTYKVTINAITGIVKKIRNKLK